MARELGVKDRNHLGLSLSHSAFPSIRCLTVVPSFSLPLHPFSYCFYFLKKLLRIRVICAPNIGFLKMPLKMGGEGNCSSKLRGSDAL